MNFKRRLRASLGLKLFLSYVLVVLVGAAVLAITAEFIAPAALSRHRDQMESVAGYDQALAADLQKNFQIAVTETLLVATTIALLSAVGISIFISRRIIGPIQEMRAVSERIADGDYHQRIPVRGEDELAELARSINALVGDLDAVEITRMALIGDVAHELRTPLSTIKSSIEAMSDGVLPLDTQSLGDMAHEIARLQTLVKGLEELSRAEAKQIPMEKGLHDLTDTIRSASVRLLPQYEAKGVALTLKCDENLPLVPHDPGRITQVVINLLGNALQYTGEGGQVTVSCWQDGDSLCAEIADTGVGIADEHLPRIFERFYRVDKSRSRIGGGSGIGLTIARHLVEAHGGRINARSDGLGRGSVFTFSLPLS